MNCPAFRRMQRSWRVVRSRWWALVAGGLLLAHQGWSILGWRWPWADAYLDDACGMLVWLTLLEWEQRRLWKWRARPFALGELSVIVGVWAIFFEGLLPRWHTGYTADPWDVFAYAIGAAAYFATSGAFTTISAFRRM